MNVSEAVVKIEQQKIEKLESIRNSTLEELKKIEEKYAVDIKLSISLNILAIIIEIQFS